MNEKMKELLKQSGLQPYYDAQEGHIEKFAELIVKECANLCDDGAGQMSSLSENIWKNHCRNLIKDHFGID